MKRIYMLESFISSDGCFMKNESYIVSAKLADALIAINYAMEEFSQGAKGEKGDSAYQIWLNAGNHGNEEAFLLSLKGEKGDQGLKGDTGAKGADGWGTEEQYNEIIRRLEALEAPPAP